MRTYQKLAAIAATAAVLVASLTACSSGGEQSVVDAVTDYIEAVAAGDGARAHDLNPHSPILSEEGLAASKAAGEHIKIVEIGDFEPVDVGLKVPDVKPAPKPSADTGEPDSPWGIDWSDSSWTGLDMPEGDALNDVEKVTQGVVPVTYSLDGHEITVPIGVAFGRDETGAEQHAFRSFPLGEDQAARYGTSSAVPALPSASVSLQTSDPDGAETEAPQSWWDQTSDAAKDTAHAVTRAPAVRSGSVNGVAVTLSEEEPLELLPGVFDLTIDEPQDDALWAAPGTPEPATVPLGPGAEHVVTLGEPEVTEAGRAAVQERLEKLAAEKFEAITTFQVSDRERACGILAPSGGMFSAGGSRFEDEWFSTTTTNIASGAITVQAVSDNEAAGSSSGNGSSDTLADEAFCAGASSAGSTSYDVPVEVLSSALTPGKVEVEVAADGTFETTTPWRLSMTTEVATYGNTDAAGIQVAWGAEPVRTTYSATVDITWEPVGRLTSDSEIEPEAVEQ